MHNDEPFNPEDPFTPEESAKLWQDLDQMLSAMPEFPADLESGILPEIDMPKLRKAVKALSKSAPSASSSGAASKHTTIRLPPDVMLALERDAMRRGIGYQALIVQTVREASSRWPRH